MSSAVAAEDPVEQEPTSALMTEIPEQAIDDDSKDVEMNTPTDNAGMDNGAEKKPTVGNKKLIGVAIVILCLIGLVVGLSVGLTNRNSAQEQQAASDSTPEFGDGDEPRPEGGSWECYKFDTQTQEEVAQPASACDACESWQTPICSCCKNDALYWMATWCGDYYAQVREKDATGCKWDYRCCGKE